MAPSSWLMAVLVLMAMVTPVAMNICLPSLPAMARELNATPGAAQLTLSAYVFAFAFGQLVHGPLADSFGRKRVALLGMLLFGLFSVMAALAPDIDSLIVLRALQGFVGATASVIVFALVQDIYETPDEVSRGISTVVLMSNFAPLLAPTLGAHLLELFGWRAVFWSLALLALITSTMI